MTNVPDRPRPEAIMRAFEEAAAERGWGVGWTTNLHVTAPDGSKTVLVETFDEAGLPAYYVESPSLAVGGDKEWGPVMTDGTLGHLIEVVDQAMYRD